jgi:hypothetical protein
MTDCLNYSSNILIHITPSEIKGMIYVLVFHHEFEVVPSQLSRKIPVTVFQSSFYPLSGLWIAPNSINHNAAGPQADPWPLKIFPRVQKKQK